MIHVLLTNGKTALFEASDRIETAHADPNTAAKPIEIFNGWASNLPTLPGRRGRFFRANFRGPWWHFATARIVPDPTPIRKEEVPC